MTSDVQLIVVLHEVESRKMSNTGHLAKLVLSDCLLRVQGSRTRDDVDLALLEETHAADGRPWRTVLFYPGLGAEPASQELRVAGERLRLVVPDGTWGQARRMVKRIPELARLPRVSLPAIPAFVERTAMRPRGNPDDAARVSTCEAIAAAYGQLGESAAEAALYGVYDQAALRIALMRGKVPLSEHRYVLEVGQRDSTLNPN